MLQSKLFEILKSKAESVQAIVAKINNMEAAFKYTIHITKQQGGKTVAVTGVAKTEQERLTKACKDSGLRLLQPPLKAHANDIHTALTPVDWGIAETGTLVLDSTSEDIRIATMLAETHVAILPASKIKPDTAAIENELNAILKTDTPTYYTFITGASRTADIERVLAVGVHGPQELHILIMEESEVEV
jgi:L-lactate dehydrogenase complex protein LldG